MKFALTLLLMLTLIACSGSPTATPAPTIDVGAIQTKAAIAVLATQNANVPTKTKTTIPVLATQTANVPTKTNPSEPSNTPAATKTLPPTDTPEPTNTPNPT